MDPELAMFILGEMDRHTVDPSRVAFEITETAAIGELDAARSLITKLRECGCCFALDDFGSGLSSFAYLKNLPVGYLKIGGGFVRNTLVDTVDHAMVAAIHQAGVSAGLRTMAECVEDTHLKRRLVTMGIDAAPDYAIHRPEPAWPLLAARPWAERDH